MNPAITPITNDQLERSLIETFLQSGLQDDDSVDGIRQELRQRGYKTMKLVELYATAYLYKDWETYQRKVAS